MLMTIKSIIISKFFSTSDSVPQYSENSHFVDDIQKDAKPSRRDKSLQPLQAK